MKKFLGMQEYEWSTHQPLIKAVMELYVPAFVLELGMGDDSTPIFLKYNSKLLSVENDSVWIDYMKNKYENIDVIYHDLKDENIKLGTHLYELVEEKKNEIIKFYNSLNIPDLKPNLLFVDQFTSCRTLSINALSNKFDIIIYHDCQSAGIPWYEYNLINVKGFINYYLKVNNSSWTALMVKEDKGYEALNTIIKPHIQEYKNKYPEVGLMELTQTY